MRGAEGIKGVATSDPELLDLILPYRDLLTEGSEFLALRRNLQKLAEEQVEPSGPDIGNLDELLSFTAGKRVMIGGARREDVRRQLEQLFQFKRLEWEDYERTQSAKLDSLQQSVKAGGVDLVLILKSFVHHHVSEQLRPVCQRNGVVCLMVDHGYGPAQVAETLARASPQSPARNHGIAKRGPLGTRLNGRSDHSPLTTDHSLTRVSEFPIIASVLIGAALAMCAWGGSDYFARAFAFVETDFADKLRRMRVLPRNLRAILFCWLGATAGVSIVIWIGWACDHRPPGRLCAVLPSLVHPPPHGRTRKEQIEDQLADSMVSLSSAINAGLSLAQALEILAKQSPPPIARSSSRSTANTRWASRWRPASSRPSRGCKSENFSLFAAAMDASRQSGGRLNETVERIAHSVRELQRLERKISRRNRPGPHVGRLHGPRPRRDPLALLLRFRPRKHVAAVHRGPRPADAFHCGHHEHRRLLLGTAHP